jgi:hypothetical protein
MKLPFVHEGGWFPLAIQSAYIHVHSFWHRCQTHSLGIINQLLLHIHSKNKNKKTLSNQRKKGFFPCCSIEIALITPRDRLRPSSFHAVIGTSWTFGSLLTASSWGAIWAKSPVTRGGLNAIIQTDVPEKLLISKPKSHQANLEHKTEECSYISWITIIVPRRMSFGLEVDITLFILI